MAPATRKSSGEEKRQSVPADLIEDNDGSRKVDPLLRPYEEEVSLYPTAHLVPDKYKIPAIISPSSFKKVHSKASGSGDPSVDAMLAIATSLREISSVLSDMNSNLDAIAYSVLH